jgi:hypothetical protein
MPIQVAIRNSQTTPDAEKPCSLSESPTLTSEKERHADGQRQGVPSKLLHRIECSEVYNHLRHFPLGNETSVPS